MYCIVFLPLLDPNNPPQIQSKPAAAPSFLSWFTAGLRKLLMFNIRDETQRRFDADEPGLVSTAQTSACVPPPFTRAPPACFRREELLLLLQTQRSLRLAKGMSARCVTVSCGH